jgi:starch-binding outer membrane protein, SusD/RagB family
MRSPTPNTRPMRNRRFLGALAAAVMSVGTLNGCTDLNVTNPQQSSQSFWKTSDDALRGVTAVYNALELLGVFGRWQAFANDIRSDIGTAQTSPWGDLANFNRFQLSDYNFDVNRDIWSQNYELIGRANLVIANVPGIQMDATLRDRIVGEAKFLRALAYFNLVTLYDNVPLVTAPPKPEDRPAQATPEQTWAQIEKDLSEAAAVLPEKSQYATADRGRATKGAALGMLGKARLQQRKWAEAAQALGQVISSGQYSLLPNYADNFREETELTNSESLFEVAAEDMYPTFTGLSFPKMIGPCYRPGAPLPEYNPTYCDGRPTRWYFDQFAASKTAINGVDPRMDVTLLYNDPTRANEMVYAKTRGSYFVDNPATTDVREDTMIFFRKYGETNIQSDQRWDNPINYRVIRYADVLLMQAEALNEQNQTANAYQYINQVRQRASKGAVAGLTQAQLRDTILYERLLEFGLESSRWNDLRRQNLLTAANLPTLVTHDPDFSRFTVGKSERLPIPTTERNLNPNIQQNPGW